MNCLRDTENNKYKRRKTKNKDPVCFFVCEILKFKVDWGSSAPEQALPFADLQGNSFFKMSTFR